MQFMFSALLAERGRRAMSVDTSHLPDVLPTTAACCLAGLSVVVVVVHFAMID